MRNLTGKYQLPDFFERLKHAEGKGLLLDFDGTLAPFHPDPQEVRLYPGVGDLLNQLLEHGKTRVALVTGRFTQSVLPLLPLVRYPEIWGSHGLERLHADGKYQVTPVDERATRGLGRARRWAGQRGLLPECDQKPGCLALNLRGLKPALAQRTHDAAMKDWSRIASEAGLILQETDGGLELRVPSRNKGDALRTIRSEMGPNALFAYLGDDLTDEDAFRALGPTDLGVLVRPEFRPTSADFWIRPPDELRAFFESWLRAEG
ncbi:MAG: trehalose-phosphatase [Acidobacteriota bacterium]